MGLLRCFRQMVLLVLLCGASRAQTFNYQTQREQLISLDGLWRFHTGDNPKYADPNFDDRSWSLLRSDKDWGQQGYKGYGGVAWYRFRVQAVPDGPLALLLTKIADAYQVFADGQLVGALGTMPPRAASYGSHLALFQISARGSSPSLSIALRVWRNPGSAETSGGGPLQGSSLLGAPSLLQSRYRASRIEDIWSDFDSLILVVLNTIAGLAALSLYFARRSEHEYLWYSVASLLGALIWFLGISFKITPLPEIGTYLIEPITNCLDAIIWVLFLSSFYRARHRWFFWIALITPVLAFIVEQLSLTIFPSLTLALVGRFSPFLIVQVFAIWTGWHAMQRGSIEARLQFGPVLLHSVVALIAITDFCLASWGIPPPKLLLPLGNAVEIGLFRFMPDNFTALLNLLSFLAILIARFARTRRDEEQHGRELEAARTVQQVLVPDETPAIPGFSIASVYRPAQQVGGDFFQVLDMATGGALVAIGDVSGKGLPAAMTVSLIVGALRTLAEQTESPAAILEGLNRRLVGRSGFTTCLIALLRPDGESLLANAGHLPPYRNGEEITITSNLPLGISPDTDYTDLPLTLCPEDRLTFVSDGVVEAKNSKGELFGFDRTRSNSMQTAEAIATTARRFGQEDDITVLTVEYRPLAMAV